VLFLLWTVAGVSMISLNAPGTLPGSVSNRIISFAVRAASYFAVTVLLLYVGNLTEKELPRRKLAWLVGILALYATGLGVAAMLLPHFAFTSPSELLVPSGVRSNKFIQASMHPALAQVQDIFGSGTGQGRPRRRLTTPTPGVNACPCLRRGCWSQQGSTARGDSA